MKRLIIFLVRKRLGLKKGEHFRFTNQRSKYDYYYFDTDCVRKVTFYNKNFIHDSFSNVSLNWLLDDKCSIKKTGYFEPMDEVI